MKLSTIWKCITPPHLTSATVAVAALVTSLQTSGAQAQGPTWQEWSKSNCDEVVELRAHARDGKSPFGIPANQELQERLYFDSNWPEPVQVAGIYPLVDNRKVLADFTFHATEVAPRHGLRRLYDWFPGDSSISTPVPPVAYILPKGPRTLVLELHYYNLSGPAQVDQSGVALCLVRGAHLRSSPAGVASFDVPNLRIPRNTTQHVATRTCTVASDQPVLLQFAAPGLHRLGRGFRLTIERADGSRPLTLEGDYSFGDRRTYRLYPDPVVYRGDRITTTCTYDNPLSVDVAGGWRSGEEVCRMTVLYYPDNDFICE
ncbi:MAG: hypothetical protein ABW252_19025 [Polyangiales bacterium]